MSIKTSTNIAGKYVTAAKQQLVNTMTLPARQQASNNTVSGDIYSASCTLAVIFFGTLEVSVLIPIPASSNGYAISP
jgi:hypothetical protein